jgi:DNA (cytosine-5)-methyltransferase 1
MDEVHASSARRLFTVVSMFAGGGGSSIGYRLAGGQVLMVNEFIKEACRTYAKNFPETIVDGRDIRRINGIKVEGRHDGVTQFIAQAGLAPMDLDILDGSPPCTEFSRAGKGLAATWIVKKHSDSRQRGAGMLFYDFLYVAKRARPKVVIAENVPDLATSKKNSALFGDFLEASRYFRKPGTENQRAYYTNWKVLNAADFGVPQSRRRMFLVGIRRDVAETLGIFSDEDILSVFPEPTSEHVSVRQALEDLDQPVREMQTWRRSMMTSSQYRDVLMLPRNPHKLIRLRHVGIEDRNWNLIRSSWDLPAPTLTCSGQKPSGGLGGVIHPEADRKFTLSELKRLFGLPDDYMVTGTLGQAAERIGNMVAPFVTKVIAESVYEKILRPYSQRHRSLAA